MGHSYAKRNATQRNATQRNATQRNATQRNATQRIFLAAILLFLGGGSAVALAAPTTPTADFIDNNDGTVTHKTTGLTWKRCAEGQTWSGSTCSSTGATYPWNQAMALTASFAGKNDWRLPRVDELLTIVEYANTQPAINGTIFPNTPASEFWAATDQTDPAYAIAIFFYDGETSFGNKTTDKKYLRLVRGGQSLDSSGLYSPNTDFADNGNGTVTHNKTGLTWKRCAEGQNWTGSSCSGTKQTYLWAQASALTSTYAGASDWRLPSTYELLTLVEWSKFNPAMNGAIFPNMQSAWGAPDHFFWSGTAYAAHPADVWVVQFWDGGSGWAGKGNLNAVRLVRGGQSLGTLSSLLSLNLTCPNALNASVSGSCTASANYSDTSSKAVSVSWSSSNAAALGVSSNGSLTAGTPSADISVMISASYSEGGVSKTASAVVIVKAATTSPATSHGPDCLFNWAEVHVPANFSPAGSSSQTSGTYYYRYYAKSESYLASSSDGNAYYADKSSGVVNLGPLTQWYATAGCQP